MNPPARLGPLEREPLNPDAHTDHLSYSFHMQSDTDVPDLYQGGYLTSSIFYSAILC